MVLFRGLALGLIGSMGEKRSKHTTSKRNTAPDKRLMQLARLIGKHMARAFLRRRKRPADNKQSEGSDAQEDR